MSSEAKHRVAIIGAGRIGRIHARNAALNSRIELAGIVDPVRVTYTALRNAASVATLVLTTNTLVADMRSLPIMARTGWPVIMDATHSAQLPGGQGACSGGERRHVPALAKAAVAAGANGVFLECHPDPDKALCDGPNSWPLHKLPELLQNLAAIWSLHDLS